MKGIFLLIILLAFASSGCVLLSDMMPVYAQQTAPAGDPIRGEELFRVGVEGAPACSGCHLTSKGGSGFSLGPNLEGISARAAERVEGLTVEQYITTSILKPRAFVVPGFRVSMFEGYVDYLTDQDIVDLIAFLMTR